jgi:hypothetical protein
MTPVQPLDYAVNHDQLEELKAMDLLEYTVSPFEDNSRPHEIYDAEDTWPIAC